MILSKSLRNAQMARIARCSMRSIRTIRTNLRGFGTTKAVPNSVGRPRSITPPMLGALYDRLIEKLHIYRDETALFLWDEFDVQVTSSSIGMPVQENRTPHCTGTKRRPTRLLPSQFIGVPFIPLGLH